MKNGQSAAAETKTGQIRHLSPLAVWALSFGCSVGWGAFIMPGTTFLPIAGPAGTAIGLVAGAAIMFVIGANYHFLMNRYPGAGGLFSYVKHHFGYDHAVLSSWFLTLVYLAIIWANCTALPLIFRNLFGNALMFGRMYTLAGYDVYAGEVLLSLASILLFGAACFRGGKTASAVQIAGAIALAFCVAAGFIAAMTHTDPGAAESNPAFSPAHRPLAGSLLIVFLAPWAYAGFESISQTTEEFRFPVKKSLGIMGASLITSALVYIALALIAASTVPEGYSGWTEYVGDLGNPALSGVSAAPAFYAVYRALGEPGKLLMAAAAAGGIITGLVGNMIAASRLICHAAREGIIEKKLGRVSCSGTPEKAVLLLMLISLPIPFLGRSAIGWVVDVNTVGVTIVYAYVSAATLKGALESREKTAAATGAAGIAISLFFLVYFFIPASWSVSSLAPESYLFLLAWLLAGFMILYLAFRRDRNDRIGKSTTVWIVLVLLLFLTAMIWARQIAAADMEAVRGKLAEYVGGSAASSAQGQAAMTDITRELNGLTEHVLWNTGLLFLIIFAALAVVFRSYSKVQRSHETAKEDRKTAEESSQAKTTFLSNMSHDIRTPMNAIIGYVGLARKQPNLPPAVSGYLSKIEASSDHLLALINDVLEMSRIESGKMELTPVSTDLPAVMDNLRSLFSAQMETKGLEYAVTCENISDPVVLCDANRLNRVLQNLVSNAYKFTPRGGKVTVTLTQTGKEGENAFFRLNVKDNGIGMSPEFAAKVFEAYERERTATVESIQGTGLGTAITKSIVDAMGGTIRVLSEQGKGSEFIVTVSFRADPEAAVKTAENAAGTHAESAFAGMRLLLTDDDPDNLAVSKSMLEEMRFTVDCAKNGEDAVEIIAASPAGTYSAVILDIEMPAKNGYDAARLIRSLKNPGLSGIPIVALTAKAFSEDIAKAMDAGMNAYIAKPVKSETLKKTLSDVLL